MAIDPVWGKRLRDAKRDWEKQHDRKLSYGEIGKRVAALVGREAAFSHTAVRTWFAAGQEPGMQVARALERLLGVAPGSLMAETTTPSIPEGVALEHTDQAEVAKQAAKDRAALARRTKRSAEGGT